MIKNILLLFFACFIMAWNSAAAELEKDSLWVQTSSSSSVLVEGDTIYADMMASSLVGAHRNLIPEKVYNHNTYVGALLFIGAIGLLAFFTFLLFLYTRDVIYFYYFLFLAFSLVGAFLNLYSYQWWDWSFQRGSPMARRTLEAVTLFALFSYCLFTLTLLEIEKQAPRLQKWIIALAGLNVVYGIIYWIIYPWIADKEAAFFLVSRSVILPMSLIAIVWVSYIVRSVFKAYFILGSIFYFIGALLAVTRQLYGDLPVPGFYSLSASTYFHIGIFLEIVCFALALSHRVFILNKARHLERETIKNQALQQRDQAVAEVLSSRIKANPHFIFNSLNAIKYLIQSQQNEKAIKCLTGYSKFIRVVLDTSNQPVISLATEMEIIKQYLVMESNRYDRVFNYSIHAMPEVDLHGVFLPPMLLLPFIEQAVWEKLSIGDNEGSELAITIRENGSRNVIVVENKKVGMGDSARYHPSIEREISNERIKLYNKSSGNKISCFSERVVSSKEGGTQSRVVMTIEQNS